jgi:integral membrane sensor domain MASE1
VEDDHWNSIFVRASVPYPAATFIHMPILYAIVRMRVWSGLIPLVFGYY